MRPKRNGTCGCGRKIKPQREHNDPEIWGCLTCSFPVCDYCYHYHYEQKHLRVTHGDPKAGMSHDILCKAVEHITEKPI